MATLTLAWREGANALQNNLYLRVSFRTPLRVRQNPRRIREKSRELSRQWSNMINLAFQVDTARDSECVKYAINFTSWC